MRKEQEGGGDVKVLARWQEKGGWRAGRGQTMD